MDLQHTSFRDPAGQVFRDQKGRVFRQINQAGAEDFDLLLSSGLYDVLTQRHFMVSHKLVRGETRDKLVGPDAYQLIQPQKIPFVSYPFEWSFSQLRDAALLTLRIQLAALEHGMTLKDASAYNVQFLDGKPIFIDTLSFEAYHDGTPWQAYRQFCQHFLAPLSLMAYTDQNLSQLLRVHLDGIPLDLAARLLPARARLRMGVLMHIVWHARSQRAKASEHKASTVSVRQRNLKAILLDLEHTITKLKPRVQQTEWADYYHNTNYSSAATDAKAKLIKTMLKTIKPKTAVDLGGNNGHYSRLLSRQKIPVVCTDIDPNAVEANYRGSKKAKDTNMLPLVVDLTNPGGALGWQNTEREAVHERLQTDLVMALALVHHLAISNNLPFGMIARYFSQFAPYLIIEFVPKDDSQVQKLLATRKDIFPDYHEDGLEVAFDEYYRLVEKSKIRGTKRTLYLFKRKAV